MAIAMMVDNPEGSQEGYDAVASSSVWRSLQAASFTSPAQARMAGDD